MSQNNAATKKHIFKSEVLTVLDIKIIAVLTIIFTILVLLRLGNTKAPSSAYNMTSQNSDIIIDFGDYVTVNRLYTYLGNYENRRLALSAYNEVTHAWELINSDVSVDSVFQWNSVDINYNLRYLGIVCLDDKAVFEEMVFTGPDGIVTPVNTSDYPELFDESDLFFTSIEKTYMDGTMFDEIYYARTGYEFVHHLPTYETTHPQLGKCIIALGIKLFGMNPFGYRIFVALFGILFIPLLYTFAKALFKDTFVATCVGIFITFDCMHYTLSRICTIDTFVAFFIVLTYYFMYRYIEKDTAYRKSAPSLSDSFLPRNIYILLMLSGLSMGCAIATKLTGVYAAVGLALIFICHTVRYFPRKQVAKLALFCVAFFIVIPIIQYTLPYIPAVEAYAQMGYTDKSITWDENGLNIGYGWTGLIARTLRNTNYMINYHMNLVAEHPYMSPAESWPIIYRPLLVANDTFGVTYASNNLPISLRSAVDYIGNPVIWWSAIPCIIYTFYRAIKYRFKDIIAMFLCVGYLAQYLPWFGVNRCIFIYHYYPSLIFSMLMMGYCIKHIIERTTKAKKYICAFLGLALIAFIVFFPISSGIPFNDAWGNSLEWFKTWELL